MNKALGEKIRARRKELRWRQADLAGDDFTVNFISQVEQGNMRPSLSSLEILARKLGVTIPALLGGGSATGGIDAAVFCDIISYIIDIRTELLKKNYNIVLEKLDNLRCELSKLNNDTILQYCDYFRAKALFKLGEDVRCAELLNSLATTETISVIPDASADISYMQGTLLLYAGHCKQALPYLLQARAAINDHSLCMDEVQRNCAFNLTSAYGESNDFSSACDTAKELLEYSLKNNYYQGIAWAYLQIGGALLEMRRDDAVDYLQNAADFFRLAKDAHWEATAELNIGTYLTRKTEYHNASFRFDKAIELFRENDDGRMLSKAYCEKAWLFFNTGDYTNAAELCIKAKKAGGKINYQPALGRVYDIFGRILLARGKQRWALKSLLRAEQHYLYSGSLNDLPDLYTALSALQLDCNDIEGAKATLRKLANLPRR